MENNPIEIVLDFQGLMVLSFTIITFFILGYLVGRHIAVIGFNKYLEHLLELLDERPVLGTIPAPDPKSLNDLEG